MIIASTIARVLLGVLFALAGTVPFVFGSPPQQPGLLGIVNHALYASHWVLFVGFVQVLIGISFLSNRFVPVALIMMAAFLYNSFAYHLATSPIALPIWLLVTVLWLLIALQYRTLFAPVFAAKAGSAANAQEPTRRARY